MDTGHGPVTVRQISGVLARRIVCPCDVGDKLSQGEKFGMIKFGSRTELYLPREAEVRVSLKEKVRAGSTVVARLP
jgi:phosphatidylserine decarboxylase